MQVGTIINFRFSFWYVAEISGKLQLLPIQFDYERNQIEVTPEITSEFQQSANDEPPETQRSIVAATPVLVEPERESRINSLTEEVAPISMERPVDSIEILETIFDESWDIGASNGNS